MVFFIAYVRNKGAEMETVHLDIIYKDSLKDLGFEPDGVINATGLGAKGFCESKDVYPVGRAIMRIANSDTDDFQNLDEAYLMPTQTDPDTQQHSRTVFLVPRGDEILIIGSIVETNNKTLDLTKDSHEVETMRKRARTFLPSLNGAHPIPQYPMPGGLRPFSTKSAKVKAEEISGLKLVHNYGHGGSVWTMAVGCARAAVDLLEKFMDPKKPSANDVNKGFYGSLPSA